MALDPLTASTTFATIVSLLSNFRNEHNEVAANDHQLFLDWLSENRHDEIKKILEQNQATVVSIKAILNQDFTQISEQLQSIDNKFATLLSGDALFSKLVEAISPIQLLSKQALNILMQYEGKQASQLLQLQASGGIGYFFMDGEQGELNFDEPRFIKDDFARLIELNLLRVDYNSQNKPTYVFTRFASEFVKSMNGQ